MSLSIPDLSTPQWTAKLAADLERSAAAIGRLDARISVSSVASAWQRRASWTGYATALRGQGVEIDEIDIFGWECGLVLPGRVPMPSYLDDREALLAWQARLARREVRHWRDDLPVSSELGEDWSGRPALLRALEVTARHARADGTAAPWLALPLLLRSMKITRSVLPCLTIGDKALRLSPRDTEAIILRTLRSLADRAEEGLERLQAIEDDRLRGAEAVGNAHRPGKLVQLLTLSSFIPVLSPRLVAQRLDVTLSGAGKLLTRAADFGLLVEVSGRRAWRTYTTPDLAVAFGFAARPRGRPLAPPAMTADLDPVLAAFDREMAEVDLMLARIAAPATTDGG